MNDQFLIDAASPRHPTAEANRRHIQRLAAVLVATASLAFPGVARAAQLSVIPNGPEGAAVTVEAGGVTNPPCEAQAIRATQCTYAYPRGTTVSLRATAARFAGWSDMRCAPGPDCTLRLDEETTTIAASYAVQRVWVRIAGSGTVAPVGGRPCAVDPSDPTTGDCGLLPFGSRVTLGGTPANAAAPRWQRALNDPARPLCDDAPGAHATGEPTCIIDVNGLRWVNVAFDEEPFSALRLPKLRSMAHRLPQSSLVAAADSAGTRRRSG